MDSKAQLVAASAAVLVAASVAYALATKTPKKKAGARRTIAELVRPNIASLEPYRCARDDYKEGVLLDANENSIGATIGDPPDTRALNRYPCPYQRELKEKIAAYR
jgi:histidinol-phosphate aminotransferase